MYKILLVLIVLLALCDVRAQESRGKCPRCNCPVTQMEASSASIKEGETVTFAVTIVDAKLQNCQLTYDWLISAGEIVSGQGTKSIVLKATRGTAGSSITAAAYINGDKGCESHPSETVIIKS